MNIDYIIDTFKDCGFRVDERDMPDFAYGLKQTMIQKLPKEQVKERYTKTWTIYCGDTKYHQHTFNESFSIFQSYDVNSGGVKYYDPNHFHYFYSINHNQYEANVYHENDLSDLYNDLINDLKKILGKSGLRQLKLNSIGI